MAFPWLPPTPPTSDPPRLPSDSSTQLNLFVIIGAMLGLGSFCSSFSSFAIVVKAIKSTTSLRHWSRWWNPVLQGRSSLWIYRSNANLLQFQHSLE
ncbi:hypothetical protein SLA2020_313230 [Shorea laevis]